MRPAWIALTLATLLSSLLAGCVAPPLSLTPQVQKSLGSVETVVFIPQSNIDVDVVPGNPGATGLIGALIVAAIDDNRRTTAQKNSAGVTDAVADFDFRGLMTRQLDAEFARVQSVRLQTPVRLETTDSESLRRMAYDRSKAAAVLLARVNYKLIDGKVVVTASAQMFPKAQALMAFRPKPNATNPLDDGNAIYRKSFTFTKEGANRSNVRAGLSDGLANVAWQVATDINHMAGSSATASAAPVPLGAPAGAALAPAVAPAPAPRPRPVPVAAQPSAQPQAAPFAFADTGYAAIDNVDAVPYLGDKGRAAYREWLTRPTPRAFAISPKGIWFAAWTLVPFDKTMPTDPSERAVMACNRTSDVPCKLYAVNGAVVWPR